jgi:ATP adenylyltransferase
MASNCIFCTNNNLEIIAENDLCYAIRDIHPVTDLHTLIISKPHHQTIFDLPPAVLLRMFALIKTCRTDILALDPTVKGFNFGTNAGSIAGQRIHHVHFHLVPRRQKDDFPKKPGSEHRKS